MPGAEDDAVLARVDAYLCELKETQIRDGLHVFGASPRGRLRRDTLLALARYPALGGAGGSAGLLGALAKTCCPAKPSTRSTSTPPSPGKARGPRCCNR
jgi:cobaltochelatase CobN